MTTASAIAAWEAEGLRLLSTSAKAEVLAELRAAAERIALASRARSAPGFDRCAALVCAFLAAPELCVVATCSRAMKRVAREDHLWRPLTARRFTCAGDLRRASSLTPSGFQEYSRLARIWHHPDRASEPPGMEAYSVILEIKIDGRRIVGGVYELEDMRDGFDVGKGNFDPHGRLTPTALESFAGDPVRRMTVSICVVRKSDQKSLHPATDIGVANADDDYVDFESLIAQGSCCSSFNNVYGNEDNATHEFTLYGAVWPSDGHGEVQDGFTSPHGALRLWDHVDEEFKCPEIVLKRWHASKNWV